MAAILVTGGLVFEVPATRDQVNTALAGGPKADTTVNNVPVSFRTSAVMAVADNAEGLRPLYLRPSADDVAPGRPATPGQPGA